MLRWRRPFWLWLVAMLLMAGLAGVWNHVRKTHEALARLAFNQELLCTALAYHRFAENHGFPPRGLADIEEDKKNFPQVFEMLRNGDFVVRWNAQLTGNGEENDKFVLGYESKVPSEGGWVLLGGGGRMQVGKDTFLALPLIKTK
jgi:hypothetical protein